MKNYWLALRKKRELQKIVQIVNDVANKQKWLNGLKGVKWQQKKDTKTQP